MGATVVDGSVNCANWTKKKPPDYNSKKLEAAIKAYETLKGKKVPVPAALPAMPEHCVSKFDKCVKELKASITEMEAAMTHMKEMVAALKAVCNEASAASSDLDKQSKDKTGADKKTYIDAASAAASISAQAGTLCKNMQ